MIYRDKSQYIAIERILQLNLQKKPIFRIMNTYLHKCTTWSIPHWNVNTLILGTFNPKDGPYADYYYGRVRGNGYSNQFWPSLELYLKKNNHNFSLKVGDLQSKINVMKKFKFCCKDLIKSVKTNQNNDKIIRKEFSDFALLRPKDQREYFTNEIIDFINKNNVKKVISSWGKGSSVKIKEFRYQIEMIENNCMDVNFNLYSLPAFGRPLISRYKFGELLFREIST